MDLNKIKKMGDSMLRQHGLSDWTFKFGNDREMKDNQKFYFARCNYRYKQIILSRKLTKNETSLDRIKNTILHEIAHAIDFNNRGKKSNHDSKWQRIAKEIGCNAKECTPLSSVNMDNVAKWIAECRTCHKKFYKNIKPKNKLSCSKCGGGKFNEDYLLDFKMNPKVIRFSEYITEEVSRADLYHALEAKYAINALELNRLDCYGFQRTWPGGKRLKDDMPGYDDSWWMRGISLTRDVEYAKKWQSVVFIFDQDKLKQKYKIVPYNWGYSIGRGYEQGMNMKREREEFLITKVIKHSLKGRKFLNEREKSGGSIEPLDIYLKGFLINPKYMKDDHYNYLTQHELFAGFYER